MKMPRKFAYDGREFPDPDPAASTEEVKQMLSAFFPALATADTLEHKDEKEKDKTIYEFRRRTGTKGSYELLTPMMCVAALKNVKEFRIDLIDLSCKFVKPDGSI